MIKVFLGGTCNNSTWREDLIPLLKVDYFNPVVDDWTPGSWAEELKQRKECDFLLYVITPKMIGPYSIAEVVDDSNNTPQKTIFCILYEDSGARFDPDIGRNLLAVEEMVEARGATVLRTLPSIAEYLNEQYAQQQGEITAWKLSTAKLYLEKINNKSSLEEAINFTEACYENIEGDILLHTSNDCIQAEIECMQQDMCNPTF